MFTLNTSKRNFKRKCTTKKCRYPLQKHYVRLLNAQNCGLTIMINKFGKYDLENIKTKTKNCVCVCYLQVYLTLIKDLNT